jgi:hypothetical protein
MPKEVMDITTFNARYFAGRLGKTGGQKYQELIRVLTKYHTWAGHSNGPARQVNHDNLKGYLQEVILAATAILTDSKQPTGSEKKKAVLEVVGQATNQLKWIDRRMHLGLTPTTATTQASQQYKSGVAAGAGKARLKQSLCLNQGEVDTNNRNYWLEFYDTKHRPGFLLHPLWVQWLNDKAACYSMSFWDWLDQQESANINVYNRVNRVSGGAPMNVRYLDANARLHHAIQFRAGKVWDSNDQEYDTRVEKTCFSGDGWGIFVMDLQNTLYAGSHIEGRFHHSSFLAGGPVKAAGEVICTNGGTDRRSGHWFRHP